MALVYPQIVSGADLLRGIIKLDQLGPLLQKRGAVSAALVNSKMYGVRSFYKVMKKYGIHPVFGLSIHLQLSNEVQLPLYVYAKDDQGFKSLLKISSAIAIRDSNDLPLSWLKAYQSGLFTVSATMDDSWNGSRTKEVIDTIIAHCAPQSFALGISRPNGEKHHAEEEIETLASNQNIPIMAYHEAKYIHKTEAFAYEIAQAIRLGYKYNEPGSPKGLTEDAHLLSADEWQQWFSDRPEWLENNEKMIMSCRAELPPTETLMPVFPIEDTGETAVTVLRQNCLEGLRSRIGDVSDQYRKRLAYEIDVIGQMGYADYFLIVEDFMRFAKQQDILTGPGRGSSAGSLVAFSLRITDVDPIRYGLIFERFLNPERVSMPDIDIDFADHRRSEVIHYVAQKYGPSRVAQIATFGTLSAKAVGREVGRVFNFSNEELGFLSKTISGRTLQECVESSKALRDWIALEPDIRQKWLDAALMLEGLPRNISTHAAGVILSPVPLVEKVPVESGGEGIYLTQWAMGDVEEQGLLKMDFLGLRNLTILDRIRSLLSFDKKVTVNFENIPLDDEKTLELFQRGDMTGIFQFESDGMRDALRLIKPTRFEDIFAINALYRPGPMENIPLYSRRKNGQETVQYMHPLLKEVLEETYGVIIYQEQIMEIAYRAASYSMGEADLLRRAISKKKKEDMLRERDHFVTNASENGIAEKTAHSIYDMIVKFAGYGFPKSHAVAYSLISYRLAFLKAHEPAYFYAALLSSSAGSGEKMSALIREAKMKDIQVLPPSISKSKYQHTVENGAIRIGLSAVKGVTPAFYNEIKTVRKKGVQWKTMFDVAASLGSSSFKEKIISSLIKAGALDEFGQTRAVLLASIDAAIAHALFVQPDGEEDLFGSVIHSVAQPKYSPGGNMPRMMMLEFEKEAVGFYLSEHPAQQWKKEIQNVINIADTGSMKQKANVKVIGLFVHIKRIRTKKGEAMAFAELQDETGTISCTLFPQVFNQYSVQLEEMTMAAAEGTIEWRNGKPQVIVRTIQSL